MCRKKASNTNTAEPIVLSRRSFMKEMGLASLGCAFFLSPWNLPAWNRLETIQETKKMKLAQQSSQSSPADRAIPPIDAAAPAATETATFAMG
jgi:hypothetical protein